MKDIATAILSWHHMNALGISELNLTIVVLPGPAPRAAVRGRVNISFSDVANHTDMDRRCRLSICTWIIYTHLALKYLQVMWQLNIEFHLSSISNGRSSSVYSVYCNNANHTETYCSLSQKKKKKHQVVYKSEPTKISEELAFCR